MPSLGNVMGWAATLFVGCFAFWQCVRMLAGWRREREEEDRE
jgi:hypothetical protein